MAGLPAWRALFVIVALPPLKFPRPPPMPWARLSRMVLPLIVSVPPELETPPPLEEEPLVELPLIVVLAIISVPLLAIPPPSSPPVLPVITLSASVSLTGEPFTIVAATVPRSLADQLDHVEMDGRQTVTVQPELLLDFNSVADRRVLPHIPVGGSSSE
jgi:hypothetical protein